MCHKSCYKIGLKAAMKHVQFIRGKWVARITVPPELRRIIGKNELRKELPADKKLAERRALAVLNNFHAQLEDAREALAKDRPTLSQAAKLHYRAELEADDLARATTLLTDDAFQRRARATYASRLRLLASERLPRDEAEALIGYAADVLQNAGMAPEMPRADLLHALAEIQLEALARIKERDRGDVKPGAPATCMTSSLGTRISRCLQITSMTFR